MKARLRVALMGVALALALGADCGGGDGSGGGPSRLSREGGRESGGRGNGGVRIDCTPLPGEFPPALDFLPPAFDRLAVANFTPSSLLAFDPEPRPAEITTPAPPPAIPPDSDGDGVADDSLPPFAPPFLDGVLAVDADLALLTASAYEEVIFADPATGLLVEGTVSIPAALDPSDYPFLPVGPETRTAVSTRVCLQPGSGAVDHRGDPVPSVCAAGPSFFSSFTSGAALAGGHLFVSMSNLGSGAGTNDTQYLPGSVLVYDLDRSSGRPVVSPNPDRPVIFTEYYNPTHVTAVTLPSVPDRPFVLVTSSGGLQITPDDPSTPELEGGGFADSEAAIEVIDVAALQQVATIPLGTVGLSFDRLSVDATSRVAFTGSAISRSLYGIDLEALGSIPPAAGLTMPVVLDGSDSRAGNVDARVFFEGQALEIPPRRSGAPAESCPGFTSGTAFTDDGLTLLATEFCDGTIAEIAVELLGAPVPVPTERFSVESVLNAVAPVSPDSIGRSQAPGALRVRPGVPGTDFDGPDVFFLVGVPEGELCALRSRAL